jgi:uncharacterized protein
MVKIFRRKFWSPYVVGILIGLLSWFSFATADEALGITTTFEYAAAIASREVAPGPAATNPYYHEPERTPKVTWQWMLVAGVFLGSLLSAALSGDRTRETVPELWKRRFGESPNKRMGAAFFGGALMMFGARMAQGCTSGHGISGALQFAVSSWLFLPVMFAAAVLTALTLYRTGGESHVR